MAWGSSTNSVTIGAPTKKDHYDIVHDNSTFLRDSDGQFTSVPIGIGSEGSVSAPDFTYEADPDTGGYRPSANIFALTAGGSEFIRGNSSDQALFQDGTASLPSVAISSDPNSGMYSVGADVLGFTAGGSVFFRGNASNQALFEDGSAATPSVSFQQDTDNGLYRVTTNQIGVALAGSASIIFTSDGLRTQDGIATNPSITSRNDTNTGLYWSAANELSVTTDGSQRVVVDSSGLVGIGNNSPSSWASGSNNLVIGLPSGNNGLTIVSGSGSKGIISFGDSTSTPDPGIIDYDHQFNRMNFTAGSSIRMQLIAGLLVGSPTGGDKGAGTINANAVYDDNVLLTDYVFEKYFDNDTIDPEYKDYQIKSLNEEYTFVKNNKHLSTIIGREEWKREGKSSVGKLINQLWETAETQFIYITELNTRLERLEND